MEKLFNKSIGKPISIGLVLSLIVGVSTLSAAEQDLELLDLNRELKALQNLRMQKLDSLELVESNRWNKRYGQQADLKVLEDRSRQLESQYSRVATDISRKQEELLSTRQFADEREARLQEVKSTFAGFKLLLKQNLEQESSEISTDFPLDLTERVAKYNQLKSDIEKDNPPLGSILSSYFADQNQRIKSTQEKELITKGSVFEDGVEHTVWSLRLGTIYLAHIDKNQDIAQVLFHTGSLQGKKYAWKTDLTSEYVSNLKNTIVGVQASDVAVPVELDLLQNGKIGAGILKAEEKSFGQSIEEWFAKGGLVMYPLLLTALLAFIFALERFIRYQSRGANVALAQKVMLPMVVAGKYDEAIAWCDKHPMGLSTAVKVLLSNRNISRDDAEQMVKQELLQEIPYLEKRLSLISALGAAAPLMGLLGTVSGMITLFKVITDVGTNDARILAGGISEALITTQTGLIIAIPILLVHGFLSEKLDVVISKINESVLEVLNRVWREEVK